MLAAALRADPEAGNLRFPVTPPLFCPRRIRTWSHERMLAQILVAPTESRIVRPAFLSLAGRRCEMAFALFTRVPELDLARYDRMMYELDLDWIHRQGRSSTSPRRARGASMSASSGRPVRRRRASSSAGWRRGLGPGCEGAALLPNRAVAQPVRPGYGHDRAHRQQLVAGRHRSALALPRARGKAGRGFSLAPG